MDPNPYIGKVRKVSDIGYNKLLMTASDRLSSFDRYICSIKGKGTVLNKISEWWFRNTKQIVPNHFLYAHNEHMIVNKATPIKLEFIVRGYMTGSTNTSIWPMYKRGEREMYGIKFRDGYRKNEKLDQVILTPTTKGESDSPITMSDIVDSGYLSQEELDYIEDISMRLFKFGQMIALSKGLILVDTKYEFGLENGSIILIDELHTPDSSRYWRADSYQKLFEAEKEPEKLDKDCIRDYVKSVCDPYKDDIPFIPEDLIQRVEKTYLDFYQIFYEETLTIPEELEEEMKNKKEEELVKDYLSRWYDEIVVILAGSESDSQWCEKIQECLKKEGVYSVIHYGSAHKHTYRVLSLIEDYEDQLRRIVYVTVAGMSNALSGVTACNCRSPVIACPPFKDQTDMMVNINSTLQMPSKVPVMTILSPGNVALAVSRIFKMYKL